MIGGGEQTNKKSDNHAYGFYTVHTPHWLLLQTTFEKTRHRFHGKKMPSPAQRPYPALLGVISRLPPTVLKWREAHIISLIRARFFFGGMDRHGIRVSDTGGHAQQFQQNSFLRHSCVRSIIHHMCWEKYLPAPLLPLLHDIHPNSPTDHNCSSTYETRPFVVGKNRRFFSMQFVCLQEHTTCSAELDKWV